MEFSKKSDTLGTVNQNKYLYQNKYSTMKEFHNLMTNTTSLIGYIALLTFFWAYLGGDQTFALDSALLKGNILENRDMANQTSMKSVIITIDGRQYEAMITWEMSEKTKFTY